MKSGNTQLKTEFDTNTPEVQPKAVLKSVKTGKFVKLDLPKLAPEAALKDAMRRTG
ncbi:MAG: hypothetical protein AB8B63_22560 [Granulosicoccus sp.]